MKTQQSCSCHLNEVAVNTKTPWLKVLKCAQYVVKTLMDSGQVVCTRVLQETETLLKCVHCPLETPVHCFLNPVLNPFYRE